MNPNNDSTPVDDPALRETLKRCSPSTYYAACKFRATGDPGELRAVVSGVIERFVERDLRVKLSGPADTLPALRLREDLGLDSLTMMEVIMVAEEALRITISNEELTRLHTVGQVHDFILAKLAQTRPTPARGAGRTPSTEVERLDLKPLDVSATGPKRVEINSLQPSASSSSGPKRTATEEIRLRPRTRKPKLKLPITAPQSSD